ncbi:MAG: ESPR domain-containing protein, partial [Dechloromonas sp.]|nr:ESPR domain-containing protein [Dechloromonas sp.]
MNRAYRLVWNEERNSWVAAPEIASARGKRGGARRGAATLLLALAAGSHASLAADLAPGAL